MYNELLEYIIPVDVMFYTLMVGAVIALRRKAPHLARPYRTIAYPVPVLIYIALAVLLVARFHLPEAEDVGQGLPDRPGGHPGLPDLVATVAAARRRVPSTTKRTLST